MKHGQDARATPAITGKMPVPRLQANKGFCKNLLT